MTWVERFDAAWAAGEDFLTIVARFCEGGIDPDATPVALVANYGPNACHGQSGSANSTRPS
jgi:hypothetical protein